CHQLHGAVGFCDETTLSWLSRYSQPLRRLPLGLSATRDLLTRRVAGDGLTGVFTSRPIWTHFVPLCGHGGPTAALRTGGRRRPASTPRSSCAFRRPGSPNCTVLDTRCRTGHGSGAAECRWPSRPSSTKSWLPTTRPGWCWHSSAFTTPRRPCWW